MTQTLDQLRADLVKSFEETGYTTEMAQALVEKMFGKANS